MNPLRYQELARPEAIFVEAGERSWTYREAADEARRWAAALAKVGVEPGGRVAILGANSVDWIGAALGAIWLGAAIVPLNARLPPAQLRALLDEVEVDAFVPLGDLAELDLGPIPRPLPGAVPGAGRLQNPAPREPDALATIFFTSGTTGRPKPVPHTWAQHRASAAASAFNLGVSPDDRWLCVLPLFHVGGLAIVFRTLIYGTSILLHERFVPSEAASALTGGATLASFVPTMLQQVLELLSPDEVAGSKLRGILLGGGPATADLLEAGRALELPLFQTYGMTEAASQITTMPPSCAADRVGSAGLPVAGARIAIRDDDGATLPPDVSGNIWASGPMITHGYLSRPDANARLFRDGWFFTGDFGSLDRDGFLRVETRRDDLIVSGGENVYPAQIESVLASAPGLEEIAVVGRPDARWGERVVVFWVGDSDAEKLERFAREHLADFQVPKQWHRLDALPRTASGKIERFALRERLGSGADE